MNDVEKLDRIVDTVNKLIGGLNKILTDNSVPEFDKELLRNYLKEAMK